ncbi:MAG: flavin monoamine oxidase family protein [Candidatus Xenobia bacterium]
MRFLCIVALLFMLLPSPPVLAQPDHPRVVVVGGGIAGLVTAWQLEQKGYSTCILEASHRWGGRIGTARYDKDLTAEYGMQEIWAKSPLIGIVKQLGLKLEATDDAYSSLIIDGHLYPFVQKTRQEFFKTLFTPAEQKAFDSAIHEMEADYTEATTRGLTPRMRKLQEMSYDDWVKMHHFPHKVAEALRLTIEVELASYSEQFSALSAMLEWRTFLFGGERNFHVHGGNDEIIAALEKAIHGPEILGARVTHVIRHVVNGKVQCDVRYVKDDVIHDVPCDAAVVAVPWFMMHLIQFQPGLTPAQIKQINTLGRGQYTVVHMVMSRKAEKLWASGNPFPILSRGPLGVIYGPAEGAENSADMVFGLLVYGEEAEAFHMVARDTKRAQLLKAMDHYWPGFSHYVKDVEFYSYHPASVAYWPPGFSPLDAGSTAIRTPNEGLFIAGDWTESSHSEGAVRSALLVSDEVAKFLGPAK